MTPADPTATAGHSLLEPLCLGPVTLPNRLILAPMAGVTDRPFRSLCREFGAGLAVSEMVSSNPALRHTRKSLERRDHRGELGPIAVQIAGADPAQMAEAARFNVDCGAEIIDINLGCPAKKVCRVAAGSALLRDEVLVGRILESVVRAVEVPVTLKTRTGWSPERRNLPRIAQIAAASGIAMIAVHGRTRACGYRGRAEHESLASIRHQIALPLVVNGDIDSAETAFRVLNMTGADAIMVGRAALGRPWIFAAIVAAARASAPPDQTPPERASRSKPGGAWLAPEPARVWPILEEHLGRLFAFYGETRGVRIARKHLGWYLQAMRAQVPTKELRQRLLAEDSAKGVLALLDALFQRLSSAAPVPMCTTRQDEGDNDNR